MPAPGPEQQARAQIDQMLHASGWAVQDYRAFNPSAARGIALREVPLQSGQPNINLAFLRAYPMPLPPATEQRRIVAEVERRLSVVEELEAVVNTNLRRAARLRQSILQKAFNGEI